MEEATAVAKPCPECDGRGVRVGPFDPQTGRRESVECPRCDGFGVTVTRPRPAC